MKKINFWILLLCSVLSIFSQQLLSNSPIVSPEIHSNNTVTFRLFAPDAKKVQITGDFLPSQKIKTPKGEEEITGIASLKKDEKGVWTYTSAVLSPEFYNYNFLIDGVKVADPSNVYQIRNVSSIYNVFIIDSAKTSLYTVNEVPHGTISRIWYKSPTLNMNRRMSIYTPPGYQDTTCSYPVLYLLHGMGGDEEAWLAFGRTTQILDNLIAQGKAKPMIVVMPNGNVSQEAAPGENSKAMTAPIFYLPKTMEGTMEKSFPDIVKFVDAHYRTIPQKNNRAIAGLSMGGFHSLHIANNYPDSFGYIGLFSAAIYYDKQGVSPMYDNFESKLNKLFQLKPMLFWIAIGNTDFLYSNNERFRKLLDKNIYPYVYVETGGGHIWKNWRIYLAEFAQKVFK